MYLGHILYWQYWQYITCKIELKESNQIKHFHDVINVIINFSTLLQYSFLHTKLKVPHELTSMQ